MDVFVSLTRKEIAILKTLKDPQGNYMLLNFDFFVFISGSGGF